MNENNERPSIYEALKAQLLQVGILTTPDSLAKGHQGKLDIYYHEETGRVYYRHGDHKYSFVHSRNLDLALRVMGVPLPHKDRAEFTDSLLAEIIRERSVDRVGRLAGYPCGQFTLANDTRLLVSRGMTMIQPKAGDPKVLLEFISNLLGGDESDAFKTFMSWMKVAIEDGMACLKVGAVGANLRSSQLLAIVGPAGSGKTFLITLMAKIFGGATANPYPYFSGDTAFNGELARSEFLVVDDRAESMRSKDRHRLTCMIKEYLAVPCRSFYPKNQEPYQASTFQRVIMLTNRDSLAVLPIPESDFIDKYILLQAQRSEDVIKVRDKEQRTAWGKKFFEALPAFVHYLLTDFEIPEHMLDGRFGLKAYQDPDLLDELNNTDVSMELLRCLHVHYVINNTVPPAGKFHATKDALSGKIVLYWEGYSKDFQQLVEGLPVGQGWKGYFRYQNSAGMLLKSLSDLDNTRVKGGRKIAGGQRWQIFFEPSDSRVTGTSDDFPRTAAGAVRALMPEEDA